MIANMDVMVSEECTAFIFRLKVAGNGCCQDLSIQLPDHMLS